MLAIALLAISLAAPAPCLAHDGLPDRACTPGAVEPLTVAQVCNSRTRDRRHVTEATRRAVFASYGIAWEDRSAYELDHLVPIELAGASSEANLWPELIGQARVKDAVENKAHALVCSGAMTLADAQRAFAQDWRAFP